MAQQERNNPSQPPQDQANQRSQGSQGGRSQQQDQSGSSDTAPSSRRNQVGRETPKDDRDRYSGGRSGND